jgi:ABC-2 type transport system ATP-binding protein
MTPSLELKSVCKAYGNFVAVDNVSLVVEPGSIFGLLGPNGAGKTTTLRMIMDIIAPDSGEVLLYGRPRQPGDTETVGYLPEERGLYRKMTVVDHLAYFAELHGMRRAESLPKIETWLGRVELASWARRRVEELSKGMQQKIQLIGTVLHEPDLLILDEPFSGLDPINQILFKDLLEEYKSGSRAVILSTHIMEQAEKLCDQICLISRGQSVLSGDLSTIKREFGLNSYRLVARGDLDRLSLVPGITKVLPSNGGVRLLLEPEAKGSAVLGEIAQILDVHEFHSEEPELEEIFIRVVKDAHL